MFAICLSLFTALYCWCTKIYVQCSCTAGILLYLPIFGEFSPFDEQFVYREGVWFIHNIASEWFMVHVIISYKIMMIYAHRCLININRENVLFGYLIHASRLSSTFLRCHVLTLTHTWSPEHKHAHISHLTFPNNNIMVSCVHLNPSTANNTASNYYVCSVELSFWRFVFNYS